MAPHTENERPFIKEIAITVDSPPLATSGGKSVRPPSDLCLPPVALESLSRASTQAPTPVTEYDEESYLNVQSKHPFSAFYSHPCTKTSMELKKYPGISIPEPSHQRYSTDIEKGLTPTTANYPSRYSTNLARPSLDPTLTPTMTNTTTNKNQEYVTVWPAGEEVRQRKKWARRQKGCFFFRRLTRKQKICAKIAIGFLFLGIVVAVSLSITYKTGGGVWRSNGQSSTIG